jgi:hypothetical protein
VRRLQCPWCGALVLADDETLTTHHEVPICETYTREVEALGGRDSGYSVRDVLTGKMVPKGKA